MKERLRISTLATALACVAGCVALCAMPAAAASPPVRNLPPIQLVATVPAAPPSQTTVVLYGDSLAVEAEPFFVDRLRANGVAEVRTRVFGGTAICDWFDAMRRDAAELQPAVVVIEFSGNALTRCMTGDDGVSLGVDHNVLHTKYLADAQEILRIFGSETEVYFVGAPRSLTADARNDPDINWFNSMYQAVATAAPNASYIDAGAAVLSNGRWTETLPCLPTEPCTGPDGTNVVRAPDGGHFCPGAAAAVRGVTVVCLAWSSGAYRFGSAMADGVLAGPTSFRMGENPLVLV
jgi:hypothetical protein